jgi:hypothetical protein
MHLHPRRRIKRRCTHTHTYKKSNQDSQSHKAERISSALQKSCECVCFWPRGTHGALSECVCIQRVRSRFVEIAAPWCVCVAYPTERAPRTPVCPFIIVPGHCSSQPAQIVILIDKVHAVNYLGITRCRNKPFMSRAALPAGSSL